MSIEKIIAFPGANTPSGQEPPMNTEYVTKAEFEAAVIGINHRMDGLATKDALSRAETDLAVIKSNYATKQDLSDLRADMHKSFAEQTRWIIVAMATLIIITTAVQKLISPQSSAPPTSQVETLQK